MAEKILHIVIERIKSTIFRSVLCCSLVALITPSCETDRIHESDWFNYSISGYIEANSDEYSKFHRLMSERAIENTLYGYNPYGDGYTLFLPTDEAIDQYIQQESYIASFEELLLDTGLVSEFCRYHVVDEKVATGDFPYGALEDRTFTGDRLVIDYYEGEDNPLIVVNDQAPIIASNIELTNGYIHIISSVLRRTDITGYEWLQQQEDYSILAQAMELAGISDRLEWNHYTLLAEHDSVYALEGIYTIDDLVDRVGNPDFPYWDESNSFYQFTAFHVLRNDYYLNDLDWGERYYRTLGWDYLNITTGVEIRINPGVDDYTVVTANNDTIEYDYIRINWDHCNIPTSSGPVHSISNILSSGKFSE